MNRRLVDALQDCLDSARRGEPLEACLARYPDLADQLRPLLSLAQETQRMAQADATSSAITRSRASLQREVERLRKTDDRRPAWLAVPRLAIASLAVVMIAILSGGLAASAQSIPGDLLYPVKLTAEDLRVRWSSAKNRPLLEERFAAQRARDIKQAISLGRKALISFEGVVTSQSGETWLVDDVTVVLTPATHIDGDISVGMTIEVEGETQPSGSVVASSLHLRQYDLVGVVQRVSRDAWEISGRSIRIDAATTFEPDIALGDLVRVTLHRDDSGTLTARFIRRLPTATATPTPGLTPAPTQFADATGAVEGENEVEDLPDEEVGTPHATPSPEPEDGGEDEHEGEADATDESQLQEVDFSGVLVSVSGSRWTIDSTQVEVSGDTEIKDNPMPGDTVRVRAVRRADGSLLALKIERED